MRAAIRHSATWAALFGVIAGAAALAQVRGRGPASPRSGCSSRRLVTGCRIVGRYDVTAFSPLRQIDRATVRRLRPVWSYSMRDNRRWLATPIVANGLMYVPEGSGRVTAFDAVSGDVVWIHERTVSRPTSPSRRLSPARAASRFIGDTVYWGTADSYLVALDARTGKLRWEVKTGDYHTGEGQPIRR